MCLFIYAFTFSSSQISVDAMLGRSSDNYALPM